MKKLLLTFLAFNVEIWNALDDLCFADHVDEAQVYYDGFKKGQAFATKLLKAAKGKIVKNLMAILICIGGAIVLNFLMPFIELCVLYESISEIRRPDFDIDMLYDPDRMNRPLFR